MADFFKLDEDNYVNASRVELIESSKNGEEVYLTLVTKEKLIARGEFASLILRAVERPARAGLIASDPA